MEQYNLESTGEEPITREEVVAIIQNQLQNYGGLLRVGAGTETIRADSESGLSVGGGAWASAPFRVDIDGNLSVAGTFSLTGSTTISGSATISGTVTATNLVVTNSWFPSASATLRAYSDANKTVTSAAYAVAKDIDTAPGIWPGTGTLRISFDLKMAPNVFGQTAYGKIYRNGAAVGTERTTTDTSNYATFSEDIAGWSAGDNIQLYLYDNGGPSGALCRNFRIYYDRTVNPEYTVVTA